MRLKTFQKIIILSLSWLFLVPAFAFAHQPRITESRLTEVPSPEVSKAYYGKLTGEPDVYVINASEANFSYISIFLPLPFFGLRFFDILIS